MSGERLTARITGRVQGVGFRWWVRRHADRLGLVGWVMNADDERSVEIVAEVSDAEIARALEDIAAHPVLGKSVGENVCGHSDSISAAASS